MDASLLANEPDEFYQTAYTSLAGPAESICIIDRITARSCIDDFSTAWQIADSLFMNESDDFFQNAYTSLVEPTYSIGGIDRWMRVYWRTSLTIFTKRHKRAWQRLQNRDSQPEAAEAIFYSTAIHPLQRY